MQPVDPGSIVRADSPLPPRAWLVVALLWFVILSNGLARLLPTTMHGSLVAAIPMTEAQYGLLTSILMWTYGLMSPLAGFLADRFGRSRVIMMSMVTWSAFTWLTSYTRTFPELAVLRGFMGVSEACYLPAALALISDYHTGPTRSFATGIHTSGYAVGIGASAIGGWLAVRSSWHFAFSIVGLLGIAYCVPLALLLRDRPHEKAAEIAFHPTKSPIRIRAALRSLLSSGSFLLALTSNTVLGFALWAIYGWMPVYMAERFHLTQGLAGFSALGYMNAAAVPGLLIGGFLADRWSRVNRRGRMLVPGIAMFMASPCILLTAGVNVFTMAILGLIFFRFFHAFTESNMMPILCEVVDARYRATGYGLLNLTAAIAGGLGVYFPGVMRDMNISLSIVFALVAALSVFAASLYFFIRPQGPQTADPIPVPGAGDVANRGMVRHQL